MLMNTLWNHIGREFRLAHPDEFVLDELPYRPGFGRGEATESFAGDVQNRLGIQFQFHQDRRILWQFVPRLVVFGAVFPLRLNERSHPIRVSKEMGSHPTFDIRKGYPEMQGTEGRMFRREDFLLPLGGDFLRTPLGSVSGRRTLLDVFPTRQPLDSDFCIWHIPTFQVMPSSKPKPSPSRESESSDGLDSTVSCLWFHPWKQ